MHGQQNVKYCWQNFKLRKNIYFVRKTYRVFDTNVSIYRSSTLYNQNVKAKLTANVTSKFPTIFFVIIKFNKSLAIIFNAYSLICDLLLA